MIYKKKFLLSSKKKIKTDKIKTDKIKTTEYLTYVLLLSTGKDYDIAFNILLPSFFYFKSDDLKYKFLIIYKDSEKELLNYWKKQLNNYDLSNFLYINENLLNDNIPLNTYYFQMYLKLYIHNLIRTEYYIVLDADHFFCNNFTNENFYNKSLNKAYYHKLNIIDKWGKRCENIFQCKLPFLFNQTPFIFKSSLLIFMFDNYNIKQYILNDQCSEYTLYLSLIIKNNLLDDNYMIKQFKINNINHTFNNKTENIFENKINEIFNTENIVISGIQSRMNKHNIIYKSLKKYIPTITYNKLNIAMLTVLSGEKYYQRYKQAIKIKENYCNYHNYDFIFIRDDETQDPNGWLKLYYLIKYIEKYDYIFLSDADVIITNRDKRIEDIINLYNCSNYCCLITTDYNSINTGNIIWRNCPLSIEIINKVFNMRNDTIRYSLKLPFNPKGIYEQPSFIYYYNNNKNYRKVINIIPQYVMNSYTNCFKQLRKSNIIPYINNKINRCNYMEGDFLIHFAGFNYFNQLNDFKINNEKLIKKYLDIYFNFKNKEGFDYGKIK